MGAAVAEFGVEGGLGQRVGLEGDERYAGILAQREEFLRWAKKLQLHPDDLQVFLDDGFRYETIPVGESNRKAMLAYLRKRGGPPPKWSVCCGILPDEATVAGPKQRREQLRALYKATTLLIRRSLAWHDADPNKAERTIFWDPAIEVCRELEISQSKLSALLKEFCGNSLVQTIDCVKVEKVRKAMQGELRKFVRGITAGVGNRESGVEKRNDEMDSHGASFATEFETGRRDAGATGATEIDAWGVWKALKKVRKWPEYSQNTWANGLGFATYRRLYRACVAVFGKTPHQLEMEIIKELLAEREDQKVSGRTEEKVVIPDFVELNLAEIERMIGELRPSYG